jgi:hypothetical protein
VTKIIPSIETLTGGTADRFVVAAGAGVPVQLLTGAQAKTALGVTDGATGATGSTGATGATGAAGPNTVSGSTTTAFTGLLSANGSVVGSVNGDLVYDPSEISITGATTATVGRRHVCSGTSADYTVTLPTAVGNTGRLIAFRMSNALTKLVTLDGNSTETIDGLTTRVMWAGESAILISDGSNWFKIAGRSIPFEAVIEGRSATSIANTTTVRINMTDTIRQSVGTLVDLTNDRVTVPRPGKWILSGMVSYERTGTTLAGSEMYAQICINATAGATLPSALTVVPCAFVTGAGNYTHCTISVTRELAANDFVIIAGYQSSGQTFTTRTVDVVRPYLSVLEVPSW